MNPNHALLEDKITTEEAEPRYFIDQGWYQESGRSLAALVQGRLCPACRSRLGMGEGQALTDNTLASVADCCSKSEGFFAPGLPVMESVFRLFLANGNQPLSVEEIWTQLLEMRGGSPLGLSPQVLRSLLGSDRHYGLRPLPQKPASE